MKLNKPQSIVIASVVTITSIGFAVKLSSKPLVATPSPSHQVEQQSPSPAQKAGILATFKTENRLVADISAITLCQAEGIVAAFKAAEGKEYSLDAKCDDFIDPDKNTAIRDEITSQINQVNVERRSLILEAHRKEIKEGNIVEVHAQVEAIEDVYRKAYLESKKAQ
jgi:hypothetical protein